MSRSKQLIVIYSKKIKEIAQEFRANAKDASEYEDKYGFIIDTDANLANICQNGYMCQETGYNAIGTYHLKLCYNYVIFGA